MRSKKAKQSDEIWYSQIYLLELWLEKRGVRLEDGTESYCDYVNRVVKLNRKFKPEKQFYILLHECGHVKIYLNPNQQKRSRFENATDKRRKYSKRLKLLCLEDEFKAWELGRSLAKKLNMYTEEENLEKIKTEGLVGYCGIVCLEDETVPYFDY